MNEFTRKMFIWATDGEGQISVYDIMCRILEYGEDVNNLPPDLVGEHVVDVFCDMYNSSDLWDFCQIGVDMVDEYRLGKMIIRYYDENGFQ